MNNKNKSMIVIILVLVIALITLSVAFAALSATLKINFGNVNQTVQTWNVGFDTTGSPKAATASGSSATGRTCGAATITATTVTIANTELSIIYNDDGTIRSVANQENSISRKIIENLMIAANETVAGYIEDMKVPGIYRVHDKPNTEKLLSPYDNWKNN